MKYGILFDLDGTLWDASDPVAASWRHALRDFPDIAARPDAAAVRAQMGRTLPDIARSLFTGVPEPRALAAMERCCDEECRWLRVHPAPLYPGVAAALADLARDCALCIVSNCQVGYIEAFLAGHPELLPHLTDTENAGRTGLPKWDNIRLVCARNGFDRALYVGDTAWDRDAAVRAGVPFLHAAYGFGTVPGAAAVSAPAGLPEQARLLLGLK